MRLPHVNSFFWIGLLLIGITIFSFVKGPLFQFDAGVPNEKYEAIIYLVVGVLMIVNGLVHPPPIHEEIQPVKTSVAESAPTPQSLPPTQSSGEPGKVTNI